MVAQSLQEVGFAQLADRAAPDAHKVEMAPADRADALILGLSAKTVASHEPTVDQKPDCVVDSAQAEAIASVDNPVVKALDGEMTVHVGHGIEYCHSLGSALETVGMEIVVKDGARGRSDLCFVIHSHKDSDKY
jgi:hypothetical protein